MWRTGPSYLNVLLNLLVFLLSGKELSLREGFSQRLLGHEGLQLQQGRHSAVLANETGAIRIKVDCGKIHEKKKKKKKIACFRKDKRRCLQSKEKFGILTQFKDL